MHPLLIVASLFPATALSVVGFFVLFATDRATGRTQTIGKVLGCWLFIIAALVIVAGLVGSVVGPGRMAGRMAYVHGRMMGAYGPAWGPMGPGGPMMRGYWTGPASDASNAATPAPTPAAPNAAAPAPPKK